jgi:hypothetical protein
VGGRGKWTHGVGAVAVDVLERADHVGDGERVGAVPVKNTIFGGNSSTGRSVCRDSGVGNRFGVGVALELRWEILKRDR